MNQENWDMRNKIIDEVAKAIATAHFDIGHDATYVMSDNTRMTAEDYWNQILSDDQRQKIRQEAYRAYTVFGGYGLQQIMALSFEEYMDEK